VLLHEGISFDRELYLATLLDRAHNGPVFVASPQGGMDIEQVAHPDKIFTQPIDIAKGMQVADTKRIAQLLGFKGAEIVEAQLQMKNLYELFIKEEATQARDHSAHLLAVCMRAICLARVRWLNSFFACVCAIFQVEINPFVQTKDGKVFCVDAKILFDDNAAFRHADVHAQRE
jgi:succinyl-CoA synthetase beta subunit